VKVTTDRWYTPAGRSIDHIRSAPGDTQAEAPRYRTDAGREVVGGGGIVPDTAIGDTTLSPGEQALETALGSRVLRFREAMVDVAMAVRDRGEVTRIDFPVTGAMVDELWRAMQRRRLQFERSILDGAQPLVSRLLAREIARYVFGPQGVAERAIRDDQVIQSAVRLAGTARSPADLLARVNGSDPAAVTGR
jgi:carboxyl-terminal processing protease